MGKRLQWGHWGAAALLIAVLTMVGRAGAQAPDKPTNLKFFPKDTTTQELIQTMRGFSFSLGVRCQYCHAQKPGGTPDQFDYASDEKPTKTTARTMLAMVDGINKNYIAKLGDSTPVRVECVTCHHGTAVPRTLDSVLAETIEKSGVDAAVAQYRDLRKKYLGEGAYDFGETRLNILTESLLRQKKGREAAAIEELNLEENTPPSTWALHLAGQAHILNQEPEKAKADYEKILQINPQDAFAKKQLDGLNAKKQ
jgi:Photosynthetic reaction centre cytochrome C subunit